MENMPSRPFPGTRTLLLVNFRPEYHAGLDEEILLPADFLCLPLGPVRNRPRCCSTTSWDADPSLADLPDRIQERTAGNPFFIEEVVQSLHRRPERLAGCPGSTTAWSQARRRSSLFPRSGSGRARPPGSTGSRSARSTSFRSAAVIGKEFSEPVLLERVAELSRFRSSRPARSTTPSGPWWRPSFSTRRRSIPEAEYAFKHPLTQEVAYASQLGERRARVHAAVARAIEARDSDKLDERAALLAHHWEGAGEAHQAAHWHRRAAEWAGLGHPSEGVLRTGAVCATCSRRFPAPPRPTSWVRSPAPSFSTWVRGSRRSRKRWRRFSAREASWPVEAGTTPRWLGSRAATALSST